MTHVPSYLQPAHPLADTPAACTTTAPAHTSTSILLATGAEPLPSTLQSVIDAWLADEPGCILMHAAGTARILAAFAAQRPDVVLIEMPALDLALIDRLRAAAESSQTALVLVSPSGQDEAVSAGLEAGADDHLVLPCHPALFRARLKGILHKLDQRRRLVELLADHERTRDHDAILNRLRIGTSVFETTRNAVIITDAGENIIDVNPAFTEVTGYAREEVLGRAPRLLDSGLTPVSVIQDMRKTLEAGRHWYGELINRRKNGTVCAEHVSVSMVRNPAHPLDFHHVYVINQLNPLRDDIVTGLPMRSLFIERLSQTIELCLQHRSSAAFMVLGLDRFKEVNAALGFSCGDRLLRETANRLRHCIGDEDLLFRTGGDEFAIILTRGLDADLIQQRAEKILERSAEPFCIGEETVHSSLSIGIAFCPDEGKDVESLLCGADQAMQAAKRQGGRKSEYFKSSRRHEALERKRLVDDLRAAIAAGDQFYMVYQPIMNLRSGRVHKAEALIRWNHPVRGQVSPGQFIAAAERSGLIMEIGDWVLRQAIESVRRLRPLHPELQMSINISPTQILHPDFDLQTYIGLLEAAGVPGSAIVLEFTEGLLLDAGEAVQQRLSALRSAGIQLAIDDFGTGYSSLSYLDKFDFNYLKIDRAFVWALESDRKKEILCEAIISMGHTLGLEVIAEGLETGNQRDFLAAQGCDYGQGYLLGRPGSFEDLAAHLLCTPSLA